MRLELTYDADQPEESLHFLRQRLYVARSLVPPGYESYFQERARFWSAHTSTAIEGNPMTDAAAMLVLVEGEAGEPDEQEKLNLDDAYELIELWAQDKRIRIDEGIMQKHELNDSEGPTRTRRVGTRSLSPHNKCGGRLDLTRGALLATTTRVDSRSHGSVRR